MIFKEETIIYNAIHGGPKTIEQKKPALTPIEISLTIDGFSGFNNGQYFRCSGVPEIYNQIGVFQITNIKHNVANEGWTTTIEAGFRIIR